MGKVAARLILWRTKDQGQLPWGASECLFGKPLGERKFMAKGWRVRPGLSASQRACSHPILPWQPCESHSFPHKSGRDCPHWGRAVLGRLVWAKQGEANPCKLTLCRENLCNAVFVCCAALTKAVISTCCPAVCQMVPKGGKIEKT